MSKARMYGAMGKKPVVRERRVRSDIPYRDRLLMDKLATVAEHRDHAALVAMKIATVALNDTEGMGYVRLSRFAMRQMELTREYYQDPDYQEEKLNQRLTQLGFLIKDGKMYGALDENNNIVPTKDLQNGK